MKAKWGLFMTISIHPPRAGRDLQLLHSIFNGDVISIHPPRAGRDATGCSTAQRRVDFNPPAPCGAGLLDKFGFHVREDFNPPAPCGAGRF